MAVTKKNNKPAGIPGRDDDFGVWLSQYHGDADASGKRKVGKAGGASTRKTTGGAKKK